MAIIVTMEMLKRQWQRSDGVLYNEEQSTKSDLQNPRMTASPRTAALGGSRLGLVRY